MPVRYSGICNGLFIANFLVSVTVKGFRKLVSIWQSYGRESGVVFITCGV